MEVASEFSYPRSDGAAVHMYQLTLSLTKDCSQGFRFCNLLAEPSFACRESFTTENCRLAVGSGMCRGYIYKTTNLIATNSNPDGRRGAKIW